ncbi:MAG: DUF736 domain-containing protein [Sphingomonadaceae bacterium]|nr:DUF736 domain-containing protein [Sphingomonadaceae bacterium]
MTQIGQFSATEDGFAGRLRTVTLDVTLTLVPAEPSDTENAPDYRVMMGDEGDQIEVGAGWKRVGEKAGAYVAVQIDDPAFAYPLRANLFQADARSHVLLWNRPAKRDKAD